MTHAGQRNTTRVYQYLVVRTASVLSLRTQRGSVDERIAELAANRGRSLFTVASNLDDDDLTTDATHKAAEDATDDIEELALTLFEERERRTLQRVLLEGAQ